MNMPTTPADFDGTGLVQLYPPTLPVELALRISTPKAICEAYGLTREEFEALMANPAFQADLRRAKEAVRRDGMSFKLKARLQAEELLKTSWALIHNSEIPPGVRADLIKFTIRAAGLDGSKELAEANRPTLSIQVNL
jgi:hypothetical protein